jgi:hypothetical protein
MSELPKDNKFALGVVAFVAVAGTMFVAWKTGKDQGHRDVRTPKKFAPPVEMRRDTREKDNGYLTNGTLQAEDVDNAFGLPEKEGLFDQPKTITADAGAFKEELPKAPAGSKESGEQRQFQVVATEVSQPQPQNTKAVQPEAIEAASIFGAKESIKYATGAAKDREEFDEM